MTKSNKSSNRRNFLTNLTKVMGGVGGVFALIPFLSSMSPSEKAKSAGAPVEIDLNGLKPGAFKVVEWRGKPVWVVRRTQEMINGTLDNNDMRFATNQGFNSGDQFYNYLKDSFDVLYEEGETNPKMMSVGLHCRIVGKPGRLKSLEKFLDYVLKHNDVWICKRIDIAKHWIKNYSNN